MKATHFGSPCPTVSYRISYASSSNMPTELKSLGYEDIKEKCCLCCLVWRLTLSSQEIPNNDRVWHNKGRHHQVWKMLHSNHELRLMLSCEAKSKDDSNQSDRGP